MRIGRCVQTNFGALGCSADVTIQVAFFTSNLNSFTIAVERAIPRFTSLLYIPMT